MRRSFFLPFLFLAVLVSVHLSADSGIQVFLAGNWRGQVSNLSNFDDIQPSVAWNAIPLYQKLKQKNPQSIILGVGNYASKQRIESYLLNGEMESLLGKKIGIEVWALGPEDISLARDWKLAQKALFDRLWTNVTVEPGLNAFPSQRVLVRGKRKIGIGCLISPSLLQESPVLAFGGYRVEDPLRAFHRLRVEIGNIDFLLLVCHLDREDMGRLVSETDERTRLVWVPPSPISEFENHLFLTKRQKGVWLAPDGNVSLFSGSIQTWEGGRIEETTHRIPLATFDKKTDLPEFSGLSKTLAKKLFEPLRVISFLELSQSLTYRFAASVQATMVRNFMRSDVALVGISDEPWKNERVLNVGYLLQFISPNYLREYTLSGGELMSLVSRIARSQAPARIGVAGGEISLLGGYPRKFLVDGKPLDPKAVYRVGLDSTLFDNQTLRDFFDKMTRTGYFGMTLWDAWLEEFPKLSRDVKVIGKGK